MALKYGFYDSVDGDRVYSAKDFTSIFNNLITDGVLPRTGNRNQFGATPASSGLGVTIDSGWAWFDSTYTFLTAPQTYALDAADAVLYRLDAVVIQTDNENRTNEIIVVKGTPATENSAVKPTLTANQHPICYAKVTPGLTKMVQGNIENRVGFSDCPWITGIVGSADLTQVFAQWQYDFDEWFDALQDALSGDVAGNLQRQITANTDAISGFNTLMGLDGGNGALPVENGGTGAQNAGDARANLGIPDLTNIVKMETVSGTAATQIGQSGYDYVVNITTDVTIPVPTDAIVYIRLTASATRQTGGNTYNMSKDDNLIVDMTQKKKIVGSSSLVTVGNGTIKFSGTVFTSTYDNGGPIKTNTPLTYFVKYLTKVPQ